MKRSSKSKACHLSRPAKPHYALSSEGGLVLVGISQFSAPEQDEAISALIDFKQRQKKKWGAWA